MGQSLQDFARRSEFLSGAAGRMRV